jgi:hypothetical protein
MIMMVAIYASSGLKLFFSSGLAWRQNNRLGSNCGKGGLGLAGRCIVEDLLINTQQSSGPFPGTSEETAVNSGSI